MSPGKMENAMVFVECPSCKTGWSTRKDLLADPGVSLIGYRVNFLDLIAGVFLFRHRCEAIVTIPVSEFADLYDGPVFDTPLTGSGKCPGYCLREEELRPCPTQCECAFVREILDLIRNWPKLQDAETAMAVHAGFLLE